MPRIAHIQNGKITNVSLASDGWTPSEDGSQILESAASGIPWEEKTVDVASLAPTMLSFSLACGEPLWSDIEAVINAMTDPAAKGAAKRYFTYSKTVARNHPLVAQLAAALDKTDAEVDAIFAAAVILDNTP